MFFFFFLFVFGAVREQIICYACTYTHLFLTYIPGKTKSAHHSVFAAFHTHLQASVTHWDMSWESNTSLCDEAGPGINVKPKKKKVLLWEMCFLFLFFSFHFLLVLPMCYRPYLQMSCHSEGRVTGLWVTAKTLSCSLPSAVVIIYSRSQTYWFEGHECVPQTTIKII